MELKNVGRRFEETFTRDDGKRFKGMIYAPPASQTRVTTFITPRRILKVRRGVGVREGDVFQQPNGTWGLCFDLQDGYFYEPNFNLFGIITLDQNLTWVRKVTEEDPVTKTLKQTEPEDLGYLRCVLEYVRQEDDSLKVSTAKYRLLCGKEIKEGDLIGGKYYIRKAENILGIYLAYV